MIFVETDSTDAAFYFSLEEFLMHRFQSEPVMMIWQADKCVMLGVYQVAHAEVDMTFADKAEISIVRRSSGGGAIYTDMGTFLYTMIQPYNNNSDSIQIAKEMFATRIINSLKKMGIPAVLEGRNDILVEGKKISGIAQQVRHGCLCTHGSLLYSTDLETLTQVLQVDNDKIRSKAIPSIRSRVTNIENYIGLSASDFKKNLIENLLMNSDAKEYKLTKAELVEIKRIQEEKYSSPTWTFEKSPPFSIKNSKRFPGGKIEIYLDIKNGVIISCSIRGDFLGTVPIEPLEKKLENNMFLYNDLNSILNEISLSSYLGDISKEEFLSCMFLGW